MKKIDYEKDLNARQKETYNFHKIASKLVEYGYSSILLNDDWQGADFIASHINGKSYIKVQVKGRMTIDKKYKGKDIYIAFRDNKTNEIYMYPHDTLMKKLSEKISKTASWQQGSYSWPYLSGENKRLLKEYLL